MKKKYGRNLRKTHSMYAKLKKNIIKIKYDINHSRQQNQRSMIEK